MEITAINRKVLNVQFVANYSDAIYLYINTYLYAVSTA
jgi:hypothetical protein